MQAWAAEAAATAVVILLVQPLFAWAHHVAGLALADAWPWLVALAGFLLLRVLVAGLHAAMRAIVERALRPEASSPSRP